MLVFVMIMKPSSYCYDTERDKIVDSVDLDASLNDGSSGEESQCNQSSTS